MSVIIKPKKDIMLTSASDINQICAPLQKLGITFFSHTRIFDDNSRIDLNNRADMSEVFYYKSKFHEEYTPEIAPRKIEQDFILTEHLGENGCVEFLRHDCDIDHMLIRIDKHRTYCDVWNFGTTKNNTKIYTTYLNNLDYLTKFTYYYKDKCSKLIKEFEQDRILIKYEGEPNKANQKIFHSANCNSALHIDRYYLGEEYDNVYLTRKEFECLYWLAMGKTAEETAKVLQIKKRTVETHLDNIRRKLNCFNKMQVFRKILELGICSISM